MKKIRTTFEYIYYVHVWVFIVKHTVVGYCTHLNGDDRGSVVEQLEGVGRDKEQCHDSHGQEGQET